MLRLTLFVNCPGAEERASSQGTLYPVDQMAGVIDPVGVDRLRVGAGKQIIRCVKVGAAWFTFFGLFGNILKIAAPLIER